MIRRRRTPTLVLALLAAGSAALPTAAAAQSGFDWSSEARVFGANALLGGVSAGFTALVRGEPPARAFLYGAAGGALVHGGKRIVVERRDGMGLLGRQVAGVGASISGNVVAGRPPLDRVPLSFGPVRAYVGTGVEGVDWRLDVPAAATVVWSLTFGAEFDARQTLSTGAVVLRNKGTFTLPGTIFHNPSDNARRQAYVLAHELVHVLQYDQAYLTLGAPLEASLAARSPELRGLLATFEFNLPALAAAGLLYAYVWQEQPHDAFWEKEAIYLARSR
jgi:hypothetical protein